MSDTVYTPQVVMPMIRRVFPSMMSSSLEQGRRYPLIEQFAKEIGGWNFLSRRRLKHQIPNVQLNLWCISINKVICTNGMPTHFMFSQYNMLDERQLEDFLAELGNLADLHGIIKLKKGTIWVKQATDPKQLNIDPRVMDGLMERIKEQCQVKLKCNKADRTLTLTADAGNNGFTSHLMSWAKNP